MRYTELKNKFQKEISDFQGIFFAFSNDQFKKGMESIGLKEDDIKLIASIGGGGYIMKSKVKAFSALLDLQERRMDELKKDKKRLKEALVYELRNHEYCITYDLTDTLEALGMEKEDIDPEVLKEARLEALA